MPSEAIQKLVTAVRNAFDRNPLLIPTRGTFRGTENANGGRQCCGLGAVYLATRTAVEDENESTIDWTCRTFGLPFSVVNRFIDGFDGITIPQLWADDAVECEAYLAGLALGREYVDRVQP